MNFMRYIGIQWISKPSGNCPVQADGYFLNHYFYFRSRWSRATIEFAECKFAWQRDDLERVILLKSYKDSYVAGWISNRYATYLIYKGCFLFSIYLLKSKIKKICKSLKLTH